MYSGALVESYDFDLILNAAEKLQNENIEFIIRGKGPLLDYIRKKKLDLKLNNLTIDEKIIPYKDISAMLSNADAFVVPMKDDYFLNLSLPTKILEFQAMSRPIICCSNGAPGNHVKKTNSGITIPCNSLPDFILAIKKLQKDFELCKEFGKNGEEFVKENEPGLPKFYNEDTDIILEPSFDFKMNKTFFFLSIDLGSIDIGSS